MSLRNWLITKLGGYTKQNYMVNKVVHTEAPLLKLTADVSLDRWDLEHINVFDIDKYVEEELAQKLVQEIIHNDMVDILVSDQDPMRKFYRATIFVAKEPK